MKSEEIKEALCQHVEDGSRVWLFISTNGFVRRLNIGFSAVELLGMAALAQHEICQLMGGDKSLSPTPIERLCAPKDDDKEAQIAN